MINAYVVAVPQRKNSELSREDRKVKGLYEVRGITSSEGDEYAATVAIESFHLDISVEYPDDFVFLVFDQASRKRIEPILFNEVERKSCTKIGEGFHHWMEDAVEAVTLRGACKQRESSPSPEF